MLAGLPPTPMRRPHAHHEAFVRLRRPGQALHESRDPRAWHGHRRFTGQRYSVQLNYMTTDAKARSELRRHRISAFVKRLTRAA